MRPSKRVWLTTNRNRHVKPKPDTQAIRAGTTDPTSRGWVRTPLPAFRGVGMGSKSRKGTPENCAWRFPYRRYNFSTSPRQIVELRMCALSHHIREKPSWWEKMKDKVIIEKWKEEALQQGDDEAPSRALTPTMVKSRYLRTIPHPSPYFDIISRSIMCLRSSTDTHPCVIRRPG